MQIPWRQLLFVLPPIKPSAMSQRLLVEHLIEEGYLSTSQLTEVMLNIQRDDFGGSDSPYNPTNIGNDQTISAFNVHAIACEALYPALLRPNARILDVGCGSGYLTAVFARLNPSATVYGIDCRPELVQLSRNNLMKAHGDLLRDARVVLTTFNGTQGYPAGAPYDAIHVGAAAESIPQPLLDQLKEDGILVIPIGPRNILQELVKVTKQGNHSEKVIQKPLALVRFVPMMNN